MPLERTTETENSYWVFGVVLKDHFPVDAAVMMENLNSRGIGTRPFFWPMHEQPILIERGLVDARRFPVAERISRRGFYLPGGAGLSISQVDQACDTLIEVLATLGGHS